MTSSHGSRLKVEPVSVLVCESGRRWCDAARRFVGPFQHAQTPDAHEESSMIFSVQSAEHSKVRAMMAGHEAVVILWELSPDNSPVLALTIAQIGVGRGDVLQLAAIDNPPNRQTNDLTMRIMELGVSAIVRS
ncbi:MAG: hypothetical protein KDB00_24335, partial [Planctomycetales bacterium]|nr:hypothetical protein [Planctomycetales bacterium]